MNDFTDWLNRELTERGWGYNELARRAGVSGGSISHIMNQRKNPGYDVCVGIARALGMPAEQVFRMAGLLPSLPPEVEEEHEARDLLRRLPGQARQVILATMRSLLGMATPAAVSETRARYEDRPRTAAEWLAQHIEQDMEMLTEVEQQKVIFLMRQLRGDERATGDVEVES